jgi:hypothetical protein
MTRTTSRRKRILYYSRAIFTGAIGIKIVLMTDLLHRCLEGAADHGASSCAQPQPKKGTATDFTGYDGL